MIPTVVLVISLFYSPLHLVDGLLLMWLLPLARSSGGGGGICLKPVMILFCLVLKATLSVSKVISLIRSTSYPLLGLLIAFAMLRCLMQQDPEGYSWNSGFDPKNRA